jgi:hypothetical protein
MNSFTTTEADPRVESAAVATVVNAAASAENRTNEARFGIMKAAVSWRLRIGWR